MQVAKQLAQKIDMSAFGVKAIYLFGSAESGEAHRNSDIDLLIHVDENTEQQTALLTWLQEWDKNLCELHHMQYHSTAEYILDIHLITAHDIEHKINFAQKINSIYDPAYLLRKNLEPIRQDEQ